jgi:hypothetical protein
MSRCILKKGIRYQKSIRQALQVLTLVSIIVLCLRRDVSKLNMQRCVCAAVDGAGQQDRDGDHGAGGAEPHAAAAGLAPRVLRRAPPRRLAPAAQHRPE